ncbi:MAG: hypothetical protein ACKN9E_15555 [Microcystaceae cyanobacterium]
MLTTDHRSSPILGWRSRFSFSELAIAFLDCFQSRRSHFQSVFKVSDHS